MRAKLVATAVAAILATSGWAQTQPLTVDWTVEPSRSEPADGTVQLSLVRRSANGSWMHSNSVQLAELRGLAAEQLASGDGAPVRFQLDRDAGILDCEGIARRGRGTGQCGFVANPRFVAALRDRGIGTATPMQLFELGLGKVGLAFLDELDRQNYARPTVGDLVKAGQHGARLDYLRGMGALGYRAGTLPALIRMRDHGVTLRYVQELAENGIRNVPAEQLVRLRDHGVSARFVSEMRGFGYGRLGVEDLIRLRDHGVSSSFVRGLAEHGVRGLTPADLVRLRSHGVSASYVGALHGLGYGGLTADEMVRLRTHGVTPDFIRRTNSGGRRSVEELVRARVSG